jgi:tetratricopeptide (TPR) repeat protein
MKIWELFQQRLAEANPRVVVLVLVSAMALVFFYRAGQPPPTIPCNDLGGFDGEFDQQIRGCTALLEKPTATDQERASALAGRGHAYFKNREFDRAFQDFDRALQLTPNFAALFGRGMVYSVSGDMDGALHDFAEAIKLKPHMAPLISPVRGKVYFLRGEYKRAIEDYDEVMQVGLTVSPDILYERGEAKLKIGDVSGGNADIEAAKAMSSKAGDPQAAPAPR